MTLEIRQTKILTEAERRILFEWGADIFGNAEMNLQWREKNLHFILFENGAPVSHSAILQHTISVGDTPMLVGGLGGVVTVPEAQRKGFASQVVLKAMRVLENEWRLDAALLFCLPRMLSYYQSLGWKLVDAPVLIDQPNGKILSPMPVMALTFRAAQWPKGAIDLKSLPW